MNLYPYNDENGVVYYSSSKDCAEILEVWINRNGEMYAKITCPKDRVTTIGLGKIEIPADLRKLGKKVFRSQTTNWLKDQMKGVHPVLKFSAGDSFCLTLKINGKNIERKGKFRH